MGIHSLPPELLLAIIKLSAGDELLTECDLVTNSTFLSHVCRRWREVAISCQDLWAVVPRKDPGWTSMCLARCHSSDLIFVLKASYAFNVAFGRAVQMTLSHLGRVKIFSMNLDTMPVFIAPESRELLPIPEGFRQSTPVVETLSMKLPPHITRGSPFASDAFDIVFQLLPQVRTLCLANHDLSNRPETFPARFAQVRHLDLTNVDAWRSPKSIADFFQAVPLLETFSHSHRTPLPGSGEVSLRGLSATRSVDLKHLRSLRLESSSVQNCAIFSCLNFCSSASLIIKGSREANIPLQNDTIEEYTVLLKRFGVALHTHFLAAITRATHYPAVRQSRIAVCPAAIESSPELWEHTDILPSPDKLYLEAPSHPARYETDLHRVALDTIFSLPIFTDTETVVFSHELWYKHPGTVRRFAAAHTVLLESLDDMRVFNSALMGAYVDESDRVFPLLETVELIGIPLSEENAVVSALALVGVLRGIYKGGMRLELRRCFIGEEALRRLEERWRPWPVGTSEAYTHALTM